MKVLLINGSPKAQGCTYTALYEVAKELEKENIETEIFHIGNKPIRGCMACGGCSKLTLVNVYIMMILLMLL
jgi:multimeric flavodoxin WrbA